MLIFVYGTLKKGYHNNYLLKDAKFLGEAFTNKSYTMSGKGIPFIHPDSKGLPVKGEIYEIDKVRHLPRLDSLEGHPSGYTRTTISATLAGEVMNVDVYEMLHNSWKSSPLLPKKVNDMSYYEW